MTRDEPAARTKAELLALARERNLRGRSKMNKAELIEALASRASENAPASGEDGDGGPVIPIPGVGREDRIQARARRRELADRLARLVDHERRCPWRSIEGHACGLPVVRGDGACALHTDRNRYDAAIPVLGKLGFDTWPTLLRHLGLATYDIDPIGLDPIVHEMAWHVLNGLYYDYFRVDVEGIEHLPTTGPVVLAANHGGAALPYDAAMLGLAVLNETPRPRRVRVSATEIFNMLPWVSHIYRKVGAVYASREDAEHLLRAGAALGVFPEGESGFMKPVWEAYHVQRLGRGGFVRIAERTGAPIVPVAILGAEEVHPAVAVSKRLAQLVRFFFPQQRVEEIAVFLNPLPLPVRWHIRFLPPVLPDDPGNEPDPLRTLERSEEIRRMIQRALDTMLVERGTAFS